MLPHVPREHTIPLMTAGMPRAARPSRHRCLIRPLAQNSTAPAAGARVQFRRVGPVRRERPRLACVSPRDVPANFRQAAVQPDIDADVVPNFRLAEVELGIAGRSSRAPGCGSCLAPRLRGTAPPARPGVALYW